MPRLLRAALESWQKSKFCPHPKFAFLQDKTLKLLTLSFQKTAAIFGGRIRLKKSN